MAYTTIDDPSAYFITTLWTGGGTLSPRSITNDANSGDFQPDLVWTKGRATAYEHQYYDSSRGAGATKGLTTHDDRIEGYYGQYGYLSSFDSNGFTGTAGTSGQNAYYNVSGQTYVAWQWKCNGGITSTNTDGDINSTVQVNQDAGFTIVQYSPSDSTQRTIGHGMGSTPDIVWVRNRNRTENTWFWHGAIGFSGILLDGSGTYNTNVASTGLQAVGASTFTVGTNPVVNANNNFIAYCWKEIQGFSKFGKWTGNGNANGPFVYTGFKPAFVLYKNINVSGQYWDILDSSRDTYNATGLRLFPNDVNSENDVRPVMDFLSNGFKIRNTYPSSNGSGNTMIYMAFAENPFVTSTGIPTTAR